MVKYFHSTLSWACNYLSMLVFKLIPGPRHFWSRDYVYESLFLKMQYIIFVWNKTLKQKKNAVYICSWYLNWLTPFQAHGNIHTCESWFKVFWAYELAVIGDAMTLMWCHWNSITPTAQMIVTGVKSSHLLIFIPRIVSSETIWFAY